MSGICCDQPCSGCGEYPALCVGCRDDCGCKIGAGQPAVLLRDTPEDRERLADLIARVDGYPFRDANIKYDKADAIIAALRR